jgi:tetratricopeptide (TPR) repeat protein
MLEIDTRRDVFTNMFKHFEAMPLIDDYTKVQRLEDLTSAIELYNTLIGLERYDAASELYIHRLNKPMIYRLTAGRQRIELLEMLFPDGLDQLPCVSGLEWQAHILHELAGAYRLTGQPLRSIMFYRRAEMIYLGIKRNFSDINTTRSALSDSLMLTGRLYESENTVYEVLIKTREEEDRYTEGNILRRLGYNLAIRGKITISATAFDRALKIMEVHGTDEWISFLNMEHAQLYLFTGDYEQASLLLNNSYEPASPAIFEKGFMQAIRLKGAVALKQNHFTLAEEQLNQALNWSREVNVTEEELPALITLADLKRQQGDLKAAYEFLDDVWEMADRGPYPLILSDALNVLAQIERDGGDKDKAVEAATKAFCLAWCDGPPYAYHWGLEVAKKHLRALGAPEPIMSPFDPTKFEPMPNVELDLKDKYHVENHEVM